MHAQSQLDSANDSEALAQPDPWAPAAGAFGGDVSAMNCRARIASPTRGSKGVLRVLDDPDRDELMSIARRLHVPAPDATDAPRLNGALTRRYVNEMMEDLLDVLFPGLFRIHEHHAAHTHCMPLEATKEALERVRRKLSLCIGAAVSIDAGSRADKRHVVLAFLSDLPDIRHALIEDARAAYEGDPAARSVCEVVLAYPGFLAIAAHRLAHRLHALDVPLVPRMMSEWAHTLTGIDIHPGATFGSRAFIDHGTGIVVGETAVIGDNVRLYHGVTLGAVSTRQKRQAKRHPTVQDNVTIYANATVLGGATVVGRNSTIGASVLLADSLPEGCSVTAGRSNVVKSREPKM